MLHYEILNLFFFLLHGLLIVFNLFGWIWKPLRKWHLLSISLTAFSWFVLGAFYGWGYCVLTDWHFAVRRELNLVVDASSYIHFLLLRLSMDCWKPATTDTITALAFIAAASLSILVNLRDVKHPA